MLKVPLNSVLLNTVLPLKSRHSSSQRLEILGRQSYASSISCCTVICWWYIFVKHDVRSLVLWKYYVFGIGHDLVDIIPRCLRRGRRTKRNPFLPTAHLALSFTFCFLLYLPLCLPLRVPVLVQGRSHARVYSCGFAASFLEHLEFVYKFLSTLAVRSEWK